MPPSKASSAPFDGYDAGSPLPLRQIGGNAAIHARQLIDKALDLSGWHRGDGPFGLLGDVIEAEALPVRGSPMLAKPPSWTRRASSAPTSFAAPF